MPDELLSSQQVYEAFIYTLKERHPSILRSSLTYIPSGTSFGRVEGIVVLEDQIVLCVQEFLNFELGIIEGYGYEISRASTDPHHKHISPDIKHNRIPAPDLSFTRPNLPFLIREIEETLLSRPTAA
jgi:hypothetical protein